ncbi:hypothetical protein LUX12_03865 [Streptomyces somaliensis]|nr:hypothetical protein [Streptomyces somaliensis]MCP9944119.1 hypothetical protein [Streptomyces somaliensis]MCP9962647.1 hypothetical protein [Streptomyces somaliensis]MCP9975477.1 hypothetical protein [Streptomyces somaliensis]
MNSEPTPFSPPPAELPLWPSPPPVPVEGCRDCAELAALRGRARERGDLSAVSDCNVLLRRHRDGHR